MAEVPKLSGENFHFMTFCTIFTIILIKW